MNIPIYQSKCSPTKHIIILYKVLYYSHKLEIRCCLSITYPHRHAFDLFVKKKSTPTFCTTFSFILSWNFDFITHRYIILIHSAALLYNAQKLQKIREITFDKKYANHLVFYRGRSV